MKRLIVLFCLMGLALGCAHTPGAIKEVAISDVSDNKDCTYLGKVEGSFRTWQVLVPFFLAKQTADSTKDSAVQKAIDLGGTHIVWREKGQLEHKMAISEGDVYRCGE